MKKKKEKGQALVETIILLMVLVLLFWGLWDIRECHEARYKALEEARNNAWKNGIGGATQEYELEVLKFNTGIRTDEGRTFEEECEVELSAWKIW